MMLGRAEICKLAPRRAKKGAEGRSQYAHLFEEIFSLVGATQVERAAALGLTQQTISSKERGITTPDTTTKALLCAMAEALEDLPDDEARRDLLERGLERMRKIESLLDRR